MIEPSAVDLSVEIAGVRLANPVIAASGCFGYGREYRDLIEVSALGAICTKGLTLKAREGNRGRRLHESPAGLMNSIGLENPGIKAFLNNELPNLSKLGPVIIANLSGFSLNDYARGAELLDVEGIDLIELNISCPNVKAGGMVFGLEAKEAAAVVSAVRPRCAKPLMVKLSPNAADLPAIAQACVAAGADAISLINTFKAMAIDIKQRRPVFDNISAGLSGPAIKPIALRMVWEVVEAVTVPVVGLGGIAQLNDALEFLMAGAAAIQIGTINFSQPNTMMEIIKGLRGFMARHGLAKLSDLAIHGPVVTSAS